MYTVSFKYAHPRGTINRGTLWTQGKDVSDAEKQIREKLSKLYTWYEITRVAKMAQA